MSEGVKAEDHIRELEAAIDWISYHTPACKVGGIPCKDCRFYTKRHNNTHYCSLDNTWCNPGCWKTAALKAAKKELAKCQ